jgi:glycosyltransferase involved in cell wall biosynthesis
MKILVFGHRLDVGGTQVNAIELTAALRDRRGHDVVYFATPGPMSDLAREKRLRLLPAPEANRHPSLARLQALREAIRLERPDLIHVWDWPQCLDAYPVYMMSRVPMLVTCMSMEIPRVLPRSLVTTFGTPELVDLARKAGRRHVRLLLPPVDTEANAPDVVDGGGFRERWGAGDGETVLVIVGRLVEWMKAEGVRRTIDVVRHLGTELPIKCIIVGDGASRASLEALARGVNDALGRSAIVFTGALLDPRPAYAAADIVLGMGGSALRAMAFAKPVIIVGERGFCSLFSEETAGAFYYQGIYGLGDNSSDNVRLAAEVAQLVEQPARHRALGQFSRQFVLEHFSLASICDQLDACCEAAVRERPRLHTAARDGMRSAAVAAMGTGLARRLRRHAVRWPRT